MKEQHACKLVLACAISLGPLLLSTAPSSAQANNSAPADNTAPSSASSAQIDSLIEDIKAHKQACDDAAPSPTAFCANEKAALVARQKRLDLSDDALNDKLITRGWRWP